MSYISSIGLGIPQHVISQDKVKNLVKNIFPYPEKEINRLLPVFDRAEINERQLVVEENWFKQLHTFEEKNNLYQKYAKEYSLHAIDHCLANKEFLTEDIPYNAIDMIMFVSSTGIATPSLDAHLLNERPFREDINRMPLWGLGCAGGAIGLARAFDWLTAHPEKSVLLVCCELCSLTFQKDDFSKSNLIGTALFGDGIGAVLLMGERSPYLNHRKKTTPKITKTSSFTKKDSLSIMGWKISTRGLEVIFSKSIPSLVKTLWKDHITAFIQKSKLDRHQIHSIIAHPGGKKVLEAMEEVLNMSKTKMKHSHNVLANHGNMSSATVLYVLLEWMKESVNQKEQSILCALGPGFSSELLLLEWN
ncbi:type III polyketide synthase [Virgibacillus alimentarius]|uniref:Alkylresorcinol/alkylpyrone synthase n=1 Tax=Virgibacillus alimentarius TaxID=698769 RepID=A0ABS4S4B9_9BACI|nr:MULTISPECIES: 3-oxoacyl-[acyl-carrier-protein] synthase III C-terminal domain-containing protein [Virgibacillus]MBP2256337.1 alkylresorcinol/alkylpyrone synthase [Virgibacillus alimentarius]HLR66282.1 3-oxoacyl-[acyl-carrier-protein] synthase III C-terminal domain-containing protein [Virgibacillus sp.]